LSLYWQDIQSHCRKQGVELLIEDNVIRKLDKQKSAANDYVQSVIDAHNIFNERNATVEELLSDPWVIEGSDSNSSTVALRSLNILCASMTDCT
jgi:hypothetical protein